jgi:glycosyltransferase involved in cell wall biosynthesis
MSMSPDLSIILPVLCPNDDIYRCLSSIRAALKSKILYEIIIVTPDVVSFDNFISLDDLRIYDEDSPGIYGAMNTGIKKAVGRYLYFIGQDDILLPATVDAIIQGKENRAELILANVFWGNDRIFKNNLFRTYLAWKNWCHQGIFYDRERFIKDVGEYPTQFKAQADHYVNIVLSSVPSLKITKYHGCVAWYSADGFSTCYSDLVFRLGFPILVRNHIGFFSYCCVILRRALLSLWRLRHGRKKSK